MKEISRKLYILRILHNYTQNYIAEQLNIAGSTYVSMEQGLSNIHYGRLESILAIYNLSTRNFFSFSEEDLLNVIRGKCVIMQDDDSPMYPYVITKLEAIIKLLVQLLQMATGGQNGPGRPLGLDPK
ncbi:helix-turn-helix domain-containing protein [Chitinophaga alhagiae]|nr:helix-turn-helix transcriptional regulator [Chitinophaga alhagiae]